MQVPLSPTDLFGHLNSRLTSEVLHGLTLLTPSYLSSSPLAYELSRALKEHPAEADRVLEAWTEVVRTGGAETNRMVWFVVKENAEIKAEVAGAASGRVFEFVNAAVEVTKDPALVREILYRFDFKAAISSVDKSISELTKSSSSSITLSSKKRRVLISSASSSSTTASGASVDVVLETIRAMIKFTGSALLNSDENAKRIVLEGPLANWCVEHLDDTDQASAEAFSRGLSSCTFQRFCVSLKTLASFARCVKTHVNVHVKAACFEFLKTIIQARKDRAVGHLLEVLDPAHDESHTTLLELCLKNSENRIKLQDVYTKTITSAATLEPRPSFAWFKSVSLTCRLLQSSPLGETFDSMEEAFSEILPPEALFSRACATRGLLFANNALVRMFTMDALAHVLDRCVKISSRLSTLSEKRRFADHLTKRLPELSVLSNARTNLLKSVSVADQQRELMIYLKSLRLLELYGLALVRAQSGFDPLRYVPAPDALLPGDALAMHMCVRMIVAHKDSITGEDWLRSSGVGNESTIPPLGLLISYLSPNRSRELTLDTVQDLHWLVCRALQTIGIAPHPGKTMDSIALLSSSSSDERIVSSTAKAWTRACSKSELFCGAMTQSLMKWKKNRQATFESVFRLQIGEDVFEREFLAVDDDLLFNDVKLCDMPEDVCVKFTSGVFQESNKSFEVLQGVIKLCVESIPALGAWKTLHALFKAQPFVGRLGKLNKTQSNVLLEQLTLVARVVSSSRTAATEATAAPADSIVESARDKILHVLDLYAAEIRQTSSLEDEYLAKASLLFSPPQRAKIAFDLASKKSPHLHACVADNVLLILNPDVFAATFANPIESNAKALLLGLASYTPQLAVLATASKDEKLVDAWLAKAIEEVEDNMFSQVVCKFCRCPGIFCERLESVAFKVHDEHSKKSSRSASSLVEKSCAFLAIVEECILAGSCSAVLHGAVQTLAVGESHETLVVGMALANENTLTSRGARFALCQSKKTNWKSVVDSAGESQRNSRLFVQAVPVLIFREDYENLIVVFSALCGIMVPQQPVLEACEIVLRVVALKHASSAKTIVDKSDCKVLCETCIGLMQPAGEQNDDAIVEACRSASFRILRLLVMLEFARASKVHRALASMNMFPDYLRAKRVDVIRLSLACVARDPTKLCDRTLLAMILGSYEATLSLGDRLLRRLIYLHETQASISPLLNGFAFGPSVVPDLMNIPSHLNPETNAGDLIELLKSHYTWVTEAFDQEKLREPFPLDRGMAPGGEEVDVAIKEAEDVMDELQPVTEAVAVTVTATPTSDDLDWDIDSFFISDKPKDDFLAQGYDPSYTLRVFDHVLGLYAVALDLPSDVVVETNQEEMVPPKKPSSYNDNEYFDEQGQGEYSEKGEYNDQSEYNEQGEPLMEEEQALPQQDARFTDFPAKKWIQNGLLSYIIRTCASRRVDVRRTAYSCIRRFAQLLVRASHFRERDDVALVLRALRDGIQEPLKQIPSVVCSYVVEFLHVALRGTSHPQWKVINSFLLNVQGLDLSDIPNFYSTFNSGSTEYEAERSFALRVISRGVRSREDFNVLARRYVDEIVMSTIDSSLSDSTTRRLGLEYLRRVAHVPRGGVLISLKHGMLPWALTALSELVLAKEQMPVWRLADDRGDDVIQEKREIAKRLSEILLYVAQERSGYSERVSARRQNRQRENVDDFPACVWSTDEVEFAIAMPCLVDIACASPTKDLFLDLVSVMDFQRQTARLSIAEAARLIRVASNKEESWEAASLVRVICATVKPNDFNCIGDDDDARTVFRYVLVHARVGIDAVGAVRFVAQCARFVKNRAVLPVTELIQTYGKGFGAEALEYLNRACAVVVLGQGTEEIGGLLVSKEPSKQDELTIVLLGLIIK